MSRPIVRTYEFTGSHPNFVTGARYSISELELVMRAAGIFVNNKTLHSRMSRRTTIDDSVLVPARDMSYESVIQDRFENARDKLSDQWLRKSLKIP